MTDTSALVLPDLVCASRRNRRLEQTLDRKWQVSDAPKLVRCDVVGSEMSALTHTEERSEGLRFRIAIASRRAREAAV